MSISAPQPSFVLLATLPADVSVGGVRYRLEIEREPVGGERRLFATNTEAGARRQYQAWLLDHSGTRENIEGNFHTRYISTDRCKTEVR